MVLSSTIIVITAILFGGLTTFGHIYGLGSYGILFFWIELICLGVLIVSVTCGARATLGEMLLRQKIITTSAQARRRVEQMFHMTDMLQSALGYTDANAVLRATASELLAGFGGALYVFNNSRDRLDLSASWNWQDGSPASETVSPAHCWALKRAKPHLNLNLDGALRCEHYTADPTVLEIPMVARGEVLGLLCLQALGEDAETRLTEVTSLARGIAEAMSLALSNISLREKLRTQALRDPLTGLYNRRYMEDVLERYANLGVRNATPLSAVMIDLDNFKRLNDQHGHALGDAVLREVAGTLMGAIRPSDVACRYGGEELVVLFPDCPLPDAVSKAEILRARIESLSENHGIRITASFGVATIAATTDRWTELLADADAALYQAKQGGRNCVVSAHIRGGTSPPLAVAPE